VSAFAIASLLLARVSKSYNPVAVKFPTPADSQVGETVNKKIGKKVFDTAPLLADDRKRNGCACGRRETAMLAVTNRSDVIVTRLTAILSALQNRYHR
jgi:hypothetical protein